MLLPSFEMRPRELRLVALTRQQWSRCEVVECCVSGTCLFPPMTPCQSNYTRSKGGMVYSITRRRVVDVAAVVVRSFVSAVRTRVGRKHGRSRVLGEGKVEVAGEKEWEERAVVW